MNKKKTFTYKMNLYQFNNHIKTNNNNHKKKQVMQIKSKIVNNSINLKVSNIKNKRNNRRVRITFKIIQFNNQINIKSIMQNKMKQIKNNKYHPSKQKLIDRMKYLKNKI